MQSRSRNRDEMQPDLECEKCTGERYTCMTWDVGPTLRRLDKQTKGLEHHEFSGLTGSTGNHDAPQRMNRRANLPHQGEGCGLKFPIFVALTYAGRIDIP